LNVCEQLGKIEELCAVVFELLKTQVPDERHGTVNSYPDDVLAEAIASVLKAS
jgi:hypothetical protein